MPTLHREGGFRYFFYSNDHEPSHVHIENGNKAANIELESLTVVEKFNLKGSDIKNILKVVEKKKDDFQKEWDESFSNR